MENDNKSYPLLDISQIEMLLEAGDEESLELVNEIIELYEEECLAKLSSLTSAKADADAKAFGDAAHAIAGSSANIGGEVLWKKTREMENHCKEGNPADAFALLDDAKQLFDATLVQLRAYIAGR